MDSITFLTYVQHYLSPIDAMLRWLSLHTYSSYYLFTAAIIYWSGFARTGARLGCGVLLSTLIFGSCRQFFASPRPYWDYPHLFNGLYEKAWGMPSGHSQNAVVFWGLLSFSVKLRFFSTFCLLMIIAIATSRLYLGVHFPAQVSAGLATGLILLLTWTALEARALNILKGFSLPVQLTIVFLVTGLPLLTTIFLREVVGLGFGNGEPLAYKRLLFYGGLLQGAGISLLLAFFFGKVTENVFSLKLLLTRALPGALTVWLLWQVKYIQPDFIQNTAVLYFWFWLQGIFLSFWVCLLWPALHQRAGATNTMQK